MAMSTTSSEPYLRSEELGGLCLVDKLLQVQGYIRPNSKFSDWVQNLTCLSILPKNSKSFRLQQISDPDGAKNYVAISYAWKTMPEEAPDFGNYTIEPAGKSSRVRDEVLSRASKYARHVGVDYIWTDRECIAEDQEEEAMNSMDLVYKRSLHPVGLLATVLSQASQMCLLRELLEGDLACEKNNALRLKSSCNDSTIERIMSLLGLISQDLWWKRAWIFQEDYLGEPRMVLLIPHSLQIASQLENFAQQQSKKAPLWVIEGEICINASVLRRQATIFLLALRARLPQQYGIQCNTLLNCFGKYNVLYRYEESAMRKAMSSRIFADLAIREITEQYMYDFLPIAANSCDYELRFNSKIMKTLPYSVGLCGLAMYLRNGEIIANDDESTRAVPTEISLSKYLDIISFGAFDPPVGDRELTWLKDCRLSKVRLSETGTHTTGHLWRVHNHFNIARWRHPSPPSDESHEREWDDYERGCLRKLAVSIHNAAMNEETDIQPTLLPELLERYLDDFWVPLGSREATSAQAHMRLMASEIVRAVYDEKCEWLSLAVLEGSGNTAYAIFVGEHDNDSLMFTSWSSGKKPDKDDRHRTRHVSLKVRAETAQKGQVLRLTDWVNGLALFFGNGHEQQEVVFGWPAAWETHPRKRKFEAGDGPSE
jgi:hypothetical protein